MNQNESQMREQLANFAVSNVYMRSVYNWMSIGIGVTAVVSGLVLSSSSAVGFLLHNPVLLIAAIIAELVLVWKISRNVGEYSAGTATGLFLLYSALNGLTLSVILAMYTYQSIFSTFVTVALMFGALSVYGMVTKRDLTSVGSFAAMGLIGLLIAMVVNMFLRSPVMYYVISCAGVLVFVCLTAYDTQKIKEFGVGAPLDDPTALRRGAILGALTLYLDFINLFIMMLRLMGNRN